MKLTRRRTLATLGGALVLGSGFMLGTGLRAAINEIIERNFGADIASTEDAKTFANDFVSQTKDQSRSVSVTIGGVHRLQEVKILTEQRIFESFERHLVTAFMTSTNVAQVYPVAEEFYYTGLFDPYKNTCGNQLSASFLS